MTIKPLCPIMTIGFNPPETGKRDMRLCTSDCAWYNINTKECCLITIAKIVENQETMINNISDYIGDILYEKGIEYEYDLGYNETDEFDSD